MYRVKKVILPKKVKQRNNARLTTSPSRFEQRRRRDKVARLQQTCKKKRI